MLKTSTTWTQNMFGNANVEKMGQKTNWGKKNCDSTLVLIALTTMGIYVRPKFDPQNINSYLKLLHLISRQNIYNKVKQNWVILLLTNYSRKD